MAGNNDTFKRTHIMNYIFNMGLEPLSPLLNAMVTDFLLFSLYFKFRNIHSFTIELKFYGNYNVEPSNLYNGKIVRVVLKHVYGGSYEKLR